MAMIQATLAEYRHVMRTNETDDEPVNGHKISVMQSYIGGALVAQAMYDMSSGVMSRRYNVESRLLPAQNVNK